jgi:DNA-binding CsgD family transcriptional regulator
MEDTAITLWSELLAGQWVVVDRREEVDRRTLVLRRASESERSTHAFTELEHEVIALAVRAQPLKVMAAELGRSTSRIAEVLGRVRRKLGAPTHADLLRMISASPEGAQHCDSSRRAGGTTTSATTSRTSVRSQGKNPVNTKGRALREAVAVGFD